MITILYVKFYNKGTEQGHLHTEEEKISLAQPTIPFRCEIV